jgi:hypothetical protein
MQKDTDFTSDETYRDPGGPERHDLYVSYLPQKCQNTKTNGKTKIRKYMNPLTTLKNKIRNKIDDRREQKLEDIYPHFMEGYIPKIYCGKGWYPLILCLHQELYNLDPEYKIFEIKEKFGGLRFNFETSSSKARKMSDIARFYEGQSFTICELTGRKGQLMRRKGVYKTLHRCFHDDGWNFV